MNSEEPLQDLEAGGDDAANDEMLSRFRDFENQTLGQYPAYLHDVYSNALLLNFQVLQWYTRELWYATAFRVGFVFLYYAVPYTISALMVWAGFTDRSTASVLELLLVSFYTGPIVARAWSEVYELHFYISYPKLVVAQTDVVVMVGLYFTSASTNHTKEDLAAFLTGVGWAIPSFLIYMYCAYHHYTVYAFGFINHYTYLPKLLMQNYNDEALPFFQRVKKITDPALRPIARGAASIKRKITSRKPASYQAEE